MHAFPTQGLLIDGAVEIARIQPHFNPRILQPSLSSWKGDVRIETMRQRWMQQNTGVHNGKKMAVSRIVAPTGILQAIGYAETDWATVQAVQQSRDVSKESARRQYRRILSTTMVDGANLASVHVTLLSTDRCVVISQRSENVKYFPCAWSVGFEEGIDWSDVENGGDILRRVVARGLAEEFGAAAVPSQLDLCVTALIYEWELDNIAITAILHLPWDSSECLKRLAHTNDELAAGSIDRLFLHKSLAIHAAQAEPLVSTVGRQLAKLHPTAAMRLFDAVRACPKVPSSQVDGLDGWLEREGEWWTT